MRDEFSEPVKTLLAKRAGNRCSNPYCRQVTSGPSLSTPEAVNMGVAAHITAASPDGPRYDPLLTPQQRKSYENGIWLCKYCGDLVDKDEVTYPVEVLRAWKILAEHRAGMELHRLTEPTKRSLEELKQDFEVERAEFVQEVKESRFSNLRVEQSALSIIIIPEPILSVDLQEFDNEIRGNLPPIGKGPYSCNPFGDGIECSEPRYSDPDAISVARIHSSGKVKSATGKYMDPLDSRLNDWVLTRIGEYIYDYLRLLNKIGEADYYFIGISILGLPRCELLMSPRRALPLGKTFRGGDISPPPVRIGRPEIGSNWASIAVRLKPIFDHIWREFGFTGCYCYDGKSNWIGLE
jgi:hypothetical protein